uniref:Proteasome subunit beta n=1 Tax=Saccoglossus kowalevskii TaxID=10224 RepID=A0ABM0GZD6_SACKO|nr:PREDICTED: proteasome subunit beta type-4-like [Saccoglossus kowalevskii]
MADNCVLYDPLWQNGPRPGSFYNLPGGSTSSWNGPTKHTLQPMTTGTSVLGIKFDGGVMIAADTLGSYGSLARFRQISRIYAANNNTILGGSGDVADFQFLKAVVEQRIFLGYVNMVGTAYESPTIATGYGAYMAQPLLRDAYEKNNKMSLQEAKDLITKCMKILFYRDARSYNRFEIAYVTKDGPVIEPPTSADTNWDIAHYVKGYE